MTDNRSISIAASAPCRGIKERFFGLVAVLLLLALLALGVYSAWTLGQTVDETYYNGSGYPIVRYNDYKFLGEHPPLTIALGAFPLLFLQPRFPIQDYVRLPGTDAVDIARTGDRFLYKLGNDPQIILFLERCMVLCLTLILGFGIFRFGRDIYGPWGALLALFLFVFMPDVIGNGSIYMTDMGLTVFFFFAIYALKRFFDSPSDSRAVIAGAACGLAFMSKISGLILVPIGAVLFIAYRRCPPPEVVLPEPAPGFQRVVFAGAAFLIANAVGEKLAMVFFGPLLILAFYITGRGLPWFDFNRITRLLFRGLVIAGAVLCMVYSLRLKKKYGVSFAVLAFSGTVAFTIISIWLVRSMTSDATTRLLKYFLSVWVVAFLVIVLGYTDIIHKAHRFVGFGNYMKPLSIVLSHFQKGHGSYVAGSFITNDWRYFPFVMAVKTPLAVLGLFFTGLFLLFRSRFPLMVKAVLIVPPFFFLAAAMGNKINIGLRHILPIYPFVFLIAGLVGSSLADLKAGLRKKTAIVSLSVLLLLLAARTLRTAPDFLVYFNEAIGTIERGTLYMPSNWGQDNKALAEFVIKKNIPHIKIASELANPDIYDFYKISWESVPEDEWTNPVPGFYAVGIGIYSVQKKDPFSWFGGRLPDFRIGRTFYVFQVPGRNESHARK